MDISRSKTVNAAPGKQLGAVFLMNELALITEAKQWPEQQSIKAQDQLDLHF
jgi:hypothetical protein